VGEAEILEQLTRIFGRYWLIVQWWASVSFGRVMIALENLFVTYGTWLGMIALPASFLHVSVILSIHIPMLANAPNKSRHPEQVKAPGRRNRYAASPPALGA
jgi:hypothetical protein